MLCSNNNNDNAGTSAEMMSMGVKLSARPTTTVSVRNGRVFDHPVSDNVIQEAPWTLNNMLERFAFLDTYPWLSSHTSHTVLQKLRVPQDLIRTSISAVPFNSFVFWKGDVEVQFQVTSTPLTQGMLAAVFVPLSAARFIDSTIIPNFSNVSVNQVVYLFANTNTAAEMHISFNSPQAYLDLTEDSVTTRNALGYIYLVVFNPIELAATASDTSSVSVFTRFLNNQFKVPRISSVVTMARPQAMAMLGSVATSILSQHRSSPKSGSTSLLRSMKDKIIPSGLVSDVLDSALGAFGLDKPTDSNLASPSQLIGTQRMNFAQGVETIDKLTIYPSQTFESTAETFATDADEMDFNFLKKKYSYLGSFGFSTSSEKGEVIASWPINPIPAELFNSDITQVPLLSYLSIPFQFYKGGFTYKVQVVSTSFQTGKIFFATNFNTFAPAVGFTVQQLTSQYGQAYEINQGSNEVEFSVPYVATTPLLDVPNSNVPSIEDTIGFINVVVLNPLVAPNNTPTTITCNVFIAAADDFELSTLTQSNNLLPVQPLQLALEEDFEVVTSRVRGARVQSGAVAPLITPISEVDVASESMVAPNVTTEVRVDTTQTGPITVKNLLKKYQQFYASNMVTPSITQQGLVEIFDLRALLFGTGAIGTGPSPPGTFQQRLGVFTHYQLLYRQFKGPLRFKFTIDSSSVNQSFAFFFQPPTSRGGIYPAAGVDAVNALANNMFIPAGVSIDPAFNGRSTFTRGVNLVRIPITYVNGVQKTAEFEVPFSSKFMSIINWMGQASENELTDSPLTDLGAIVMYRSHAQGLGIDTNPLVRGFVSIGDETRFGNLFQIPLIAVNSTVNNAGVVVSSTWPDSYGAGAPVSNTLVRL